MCLTIKEYKEAVESFAKARSKVYFSNNSPLHAAVVLSTMFNFARHEVLVLDGAINGNFAGLYDEFIPSLENFVRKKEGSFKVVLTKDNIDTNSAIFLKIAELHKDYPQKVDVFIHKLDVALESIIKTRHFTVMDEKAFRVEIESDSATHEAVCCFNDYDYTQYLRENFNKVLPHCQSIFN